MKFRHKIERTNINGLQEFTVNYYLCDELLIGRGSGCHIRLAERIIALTHAKLSLINDKLVLEDLSGDGLRVNGSMFKKGAIKVGDVVKIGAAEFSVFFDGNYWGFHEKRVEAKEVDQDALVRVQLEKLNFSNYCPRFITLSLLLCAMLVLFCFADPYLGRSSMVWSSGPLANSHKTFEQSCEKCHSTPFAPVQDKDCLTCHALTQHSVKLTAAISSHGAKEIRCAECHKDHNGDHGLKEHDQRVCTQCHAYLGDLVSGTDRPDISSFAKHPEFAVRIRQYPAETTGDANPVTVKKVSLANAAELIDTARIKLNHEKHLVAGLRGADGPTQLVCGDCHHLTEDRKEIKPISFNRDCASCHPLSFDDRLPGKFVPHGEPDVVFNFLFAEYAKLFLETEIPGSRKEFVRRFRPGQEPEAEAPQIDYTRSFVEQESRKTEGELFRRTACFLCHQVQELGGNNGVGLSGSAGNPKGRSLFSVLKPEIPDRWMPPARFDHGAHQAGTCISCHKGVTTSKKTEDINLPSLADCTSCHQDGHAPGKVHTACTTCHSYHDTTLFVDSKKRPMREILSLLQ